MIDVAGEAGIAYTLEAEGSKTYTDSRRAAALAGTGVPCALVRCRCATCTPRPRPPALGHLRHRRADRALLPVAAARPGVDPMSYDAAGQVLEEGKRYRLASRPPTARSPPSSTPSWAGRSRTRSPSW